MTYFVFQAMFVATAATIISGAVAERMKFNGYLIMAALATGIIYPIVDIGLDIFQSMILLINC